MKKRQRRVQRMWVMGGILLLPVALGVIPGVPHPFLNLFLWWVPPPPRVEVPAPLPGMERVLVIAPHPDDELLALGGTIAHLTGEGHQVLVVFVTNGDANQAAKQVFTLNPRRLYLVHAPSWPAPRRLAMDLTLTVPTALDPWEWRSYELTEELVGLKLRAIQAYSSQRITSGTFLASFVRQNEVYAVSTASALPGGPALAR